MSGWRCEGLETRLAQLTHFDSSLTHFETWPASIIMTRSFLNSLCNFAGSRLKFTVFESRTSSRVNSDLQMTCFQNNQNSLHNSGLRFGVYLWFLHRFTMIGILTLSNMFTVVTDDT